jgi:hypothetical protein
MVQTAKSSYINGANLVHTGFVQVPLQLHCLFHLYVVEVEPTSRLGLIQLHYSAWKQARQLHPLTGATWVMKNASIVKISAN